METKQKIWRWFNDQEYKDYLEYQKNEPGTILKEYGEQLKKDSGNLLSYDVVPEIQQSETLNTKIRFYVVINNSEKIKFNDTPYGFKASLPYYVQAFEINYPFNTLYPCRFHSLITENRYEAKDVNDLRNLIEVEIQDEKTGKYLGNLLYFFYDKETIEKILSDGE